MKELFITYLYPGLWFVVLALSISLYVILDGFDLGIGVIYLFAKGDGSRRQLLNAIGPVWDGNEVWLVLIFGGLFAGFPPVYATLLSLFYLPVWYLVFFLIFRVISIEFRSKSESYIWRHIWDVIFSVSSIMILAFLGGFLGNIVRGFSLDFSREIIQEKVSFFNRYSLLSSLFSISLTMLHGILYAIIKVSEELLMLLKRLVVNAYVIFVCFYLFMFIYTLTNNFYIRCKITDCPLSYMLVALNVLSLIMMRIFIKKEKFVFAFVCSSVNIFCLISNIFVLLFPNILRSSLDDSQSLTIINAASGNITLGILLIIVAVGLPFVIGYMFYVYRTFRGKVKVDSSGY